MNNDEKILKILADMQANMATKADVERVDKRLDTVQQDTAHLSTALEALAAGQADMTTKVAAIETKQKEQATKQDVEITVDAAKTELKADLLMLESKVVKKIQSHERRITNIEDQEDIKNPDKN